MVWAESHGRNGSVSSLYGSYLAEAATELKGALSSLRRDASPLRALNAAANLAHRIKGNAAMYGRDALGVAAGRAEAALRDQLELYDREQSLGLLVGLLARVEDAAREARTEDPTVVALPVAKAMPAAATARPASGPAAHAQPAAPRLLIAYQDPWLCELLQSMIGVAVDVHFASTAQQLLRKAAQLSPDLVVVEDRLGEHDTLDAVAQIVAGVAAPDVFIGFAPGQPERIARGLSLGIAGFTDDKHQLLDIAAFVERRLGRPERSVLLVDDDPVVRDLLARALRRDGIRVSCASDGIEALDVLSRATPDLVVLDRLMPRLEGGTVLFEMQQRVNLKSIPVVILTAVAHHGEARGWFQRGAADFIAKPFDPRDVSMRIKQHLGLRDGAGPAHNAGARLGAL